MFGDFVNAVSSVVQTVSGAIVSLVSIVYTAVVQAATLIAHLAREAADLGGQLIARAAAALVYIGELILTELAKLIAWILAEVSAILAVAVNGVTSGIRAFDSGVSSALSLAWGVVNSTGQVTLAAANAIGSALDGPVFDAALGIGIAVTVALTLLTPLDFGPSFLIGIVVGLVAGAILSSGVVLNAVASFTSSAVRALENIVNGSLRLPIGEWSVIAGAIGLAGAGAEVPYSWYVMAQAFKVENGPALALEAAELTTIALLALVVGFVAVASANSVLLLFAFVMASLSLAAVAFHYVGGIKELDDPALTQLAEIDLVLSGAAMVGSGADFGLRVAGL